jgi:tetratricopeptide (TPR) repeat protein
MQAGFRMDVAKELALALADQASALLLLERNQEAVEHLVEAVAVYRKLLEQENSRQTAVELAMALTKLALVHRGTEDWAAAYACGKEAVALYRSISQEDLDAQTFEQLRWARRVRDEAALQMVVRLNQAIDDHVRAGRQAEALGMFDEALTLLRGIWEEDDNLDWAKELVRTLANKGSALVNMGRIDEGIKELSEAVDLSGQLAEKADDFDVRFAQANSLTKLAYALCQTDLARPRVVALTHVAKAEEIYRGLLERGTHAEVSARLELALQLKNTLLQQLRALMDWRPGRPSPWEVPAQRTTEPERSPRGWLPRMIQGLGRLFRRPPQ